MHRVKDAFRADLRDGSHAAFRGARRHDPERLFARCRKARCRVAQHELGDAAAVRQREGQRDRAAEPVAHQDRVGTDAELVEGSRQPGDIRLNSAFDRLRSVESGKVRQRDPEAGRKLRQHRVESVPIGEQRVQDDEVAPAAHAGRGQVPIRDRELIDLHVCAALACPGNAPTPPNDPSRCRKWAPPIARRRRDLTQWPDAARSSAARRPRLPSLPADAGWAPRPMCRRPRSARSAGRSSAPARRRPRSP